MGVLLLWGNFNSIVYGRIGYLKLVVLVGENKFFAGAKFPPRNGGVHHSLLLCVESVGTWRRGGHTKSGENYPLPASRGESMIIAFLLQGS